MKPSRYNHMFDVEDRDIVLAYNSYTGALAEIEKENYARVCHLLAHPDHVETDQDQEFMKCLQEGGFTVADIVDEVAVLRSKARSLRLDGSALTLTIAPTLACNFNCSYCYETQSSVRMSDDTQEALLAFCDRYLIRAERLRACWFGGEPTLCLPIINRLQSQLLKLADKHHADVVPGTIITNGYLLDAAMAQQLRDLEIAQAQITIDGPQRVHDSRRQLHNGKGTFTRIIDNLCDTADILKVSVRVNVDKSNVESVYEVVELLQQRGILPKIRLYFAQVMSSGTVCADIRDRCYGEKEFSQTLVEIYGRLLAEGIRQIDYPRVLAGAAFCGALAEGYFVVSPTGHLFRCWEELALDSGKSIGTVFGSPLKQNQKKNLDAYAAWDPFKMTECRDCDILPICMGGCPVHGMKNAGASKGICLPWRYNLGEMIELKYTCETGDQ